MEGGAHIGSLPHLAKLCVVDRDSSRHRACICLHRFLQWVFHGKAAKCQSSRSCGGGALYKMAPAEFINIWMIVRFVGSICDLHTIGILRRLFTRKGQPSSSLGIKTFIRNEELCDHFVRSLQYTTNYSFPFAQ